MPFAKYRAIWYATGRKEKKVKLNKEENRVVVTVKHAHRDLREKVDGKPNPSFEKIVYETIESIDVYDAKPEEVLSVVEKALTSASK